MALCKLLKTAWIMSQAHFSTTKANNGVRSRYTAGRPSFAFYISLTSANDGRVLHDAGSEGSQACLRR
jgi:hypothetical protein